MSLYPTRPIEFLADEHDMAARPPRTDMYRISHFNESDNPEKVHLAWRIHAEGYETMGFVKPTAVTPEGYLNETIDKARGPLVDYYVGISKQDVSVATPKNLDAATVRKISLPDGGTVEDLPAYKLCASSLYPEERKYLLELDDAQDRLKELGALARTPSAHPISIFELLRNARDEVLGKREIWFSSIVSSTYDSLVDAFGNIAVRQVGEPVVLDDESVESSVKLVPIIVDVDAFIDNIYSAVKQEVSSDGVRKKMRSLLFLAEGLRDDELGEDIVAVRQAASSRMAK